MFALPKVGPSQVGSGARGWWNHELSSAQPSSARITQEQPEHPHGSQLTTHKVHRAEQTGSGKLCVCPELRIETNLPSSGWMAHESHGHCYLSPHAKPNSIIFLPPALRLSTDPKGIKSYKFYVSF